MSGTLTTIDWLVIGAYFLAVALLVFWVLYREKKQGDSNSEDYFLGGRGLSWVLIGASLFASNIGSEHLVGLAGAGASGDFPVAQFEILASFMLLLLGWLFVPIYLKTGVFTMPQFLLQRYGAWSRSYLTWISILGYILTKISVTILAGGIIFTALLDIDFWTGALILVALTGIYTIAGGLKVVVYTDFLQMFILLGGSIAITYIGLDKLGGWSGASAVLPEDYTSLWRPLSDPDFPWTGILLGAPILGVWYWCTDQFIVQRVLAAKDQNEARKGTLFAAYLKLLPLFLFVLPGVLAYAISVQQPELLQFAVVDGQTQYDAALPLMTALLPSGLQGLVVAGLLAALMSSLSSVFNSCSTLITCDLYQKYKPQAKEKELVRVGRYATAFLAFLGMAWVPILQDLEGGLFQKLQSIQSYISPPIAAVFLLGVLSRRHTEKGAKWALLSGAFLGLLRLILEINKGQLSGFWLWYTEINFLHFALFLFVVCALILWLVSLSSAPPQLPKAFDVLGWKTLAIKEQKTSMLLLNLILLVLIALLWINFS